MQRPFPRLCSMYGCTLQDLQCRTPNVIHRRNMRMIRVYRWRGRWVTYVELRGWRRMMHPQGVIIRYYLFCMSDFTLCLLEVYLHIHIFVVLHVDFITSVWSAAFARIDSHTHVSLPNATSETYNCTRVMIQPQRIIVIYLKVCGNIAISISRELLFVFLSSLLFSSLFLLQPTY